MTQEERWMVRYNEVKNFIETIHRNPSKHDEEERGKFLNWIKANRKALNAGKMKLEREVCCGQQGSDVCYYGNSNGICP